MMQVTLVQATMNGREYTHYTCKDPFHAERLAKILEEKRPHLMPVTVVPFEIDEATARRIRVFADASDGPKN